MAAAEVVPRRVGTLWTLGRDEALPVIQPLAPARFKQVGAEDAASLVVAMGGEGAHKRVVQKRLAGGRRCYAAWVNGQIAAYGWVSFGAEYIGELDLHFRMLPGEAYIWDCATLPAFRRKRLFSALLAYIMGELRVEGVQRVWIGADFENEASQHGIDRAGFRRVADLLVEPGASPRQGWLEGYPGAPQELVVEVRMALLGDAVYK